jgi:DnaJ-class molecular chaperone
MKLLCNKCKGTKKFRGMGCVISICHECNGNGFVEASEIIKPESITVIKTKRQRRINKNEEDDSKETESKEGSEA